MDNNTLILLALAAVAIYYFFFYKKEQLTNLTSEQQSLVDSLYNFINAQDVTFDQYIDYLNKLQNTNLKLIDNEVFVGFKLAKKKGTFTKQMISAEM